MVRRAEYCLFIANIFTRVTHVTHIHNVHCECYANILCLGSIINQEQSELLQGCIMVWNANWFTH